MNVEQARWVRWLVESLATLRCDKGRHVVAAVADISSGSRELQVLDDICDSIWKLWYINFHLRGGPDASDTQNCKLRDAKFTQSNQ
jgi:hypothetical protein